MKVITIQNMRVRMSRISMRYGWANVTLYLREPETHLHTISATIYLKEMSQATFVQQNILFSYL